MSEIQPQIYSVKREVALCDPNQAQRFQETLSGLVALNGIRHVSRNHTPMIRILTADHYETALSNANVTGESAKAGLDEYIEKSKNDYLRTRITSIFPTGPKNGWRFIAFGTESEAKDRLDSERNMLLGIIGYSGYSDATPPISVLSCRPSRVQMVVDQFKDQGLLNAEILIFPPAPVIVNR